MLLNGGVRRGSDIFNVMIGRATLYGASAAGDPGASRALAILKDELICTMQLCGACTVAEAKPSLIF